MAHFAQLDENDTVLQVIVVSNETLGDLPFPESEAPGIAFCKELLGADTMWAQTSYNASFRYNYAGIDFKFDRNAVPNGAFVPPQPYPSWILDVNIYRWEPPVPYPSDGQLYVWDEATQSWVLPAI